MMKKIFTLALISLYFGVFAQLPVSQTAEKKKVILEEYTGKTCVYCPDGHRIASEMKEADPDNVFLINIHTGGYADGTPNYRTAFGPSLAGQFGITSFPSGTINRVEESSRGQWAANAAITKNQDAYVNVALEASVDLTTRVLTVNVEAYYTDNSPTTINFLNVALTQDDIHGPQTGGATYNPSMIDDEGLYIHNHMLRHLLTGQWGEEITSVSTGDLIQKTYTYTLPTIIGDVDLDMTKLHVVAFMSETHKDIINGNGVVPSLTGLTNNLEAEMIEVKTPAFSCTASIEPEITLRNWGNTEITSLKINYSADDLPAQTYDWTGNLLSGLSLKVKLPTLLYNSSDSNDIIVEIVEVNGGADDILTNNKITSVVFPSPEYETNTMQLVFTGDQYSGGTYNESSWVLYGSDGGALQEAASGTISEQPYDITLNLPDYDCYIFEFKDSYGDGLTGSGPGTVSVDFNSTNVLSGSGSFSLLRAQFGTIDENGDGAGNPDDQVEIIDKIRTLENVSIFEVFPNPATDKININIETINNNATTVELIDFLGKIIYTSNIDKNATINTSNISKGIYLVNIISEGVSIASTSVIVK